MHLFHQKSKPKSSDASEAKAALWTALANSLNTQTTSQPNIPQPNTPRDMLVERANLFGKTVADNVIQKTGSC